MKKTILLIMAVLMNCLCGGLLAAVVGIDPAIGAISANLISLSLGSVIPSGAFGAGLFAEIWTGETIKAFRNAIGSIGWLNKIRSYDQHVDKDMINFVTIGVDPKVLVNNTTYPMNITSLEDANKAISLDKYDTEPTIVTDDELHAASYDKMASVIDRHKEALLAELPKRAIHAIAPAGDTNATPILLTTGEADSGGRNKLVRADIVELKNKFDKLKVPIAGRILVLCSDHVNDLLTMDQKFPDQYANYNSGKIINMYGFEVYEYTDCPYYKVSTKAKLAISAEPTAKDMQASVAFYAPRMMRATGSLTSYLQEAKNDPVNRASTIGFRQYFVAMPLKEEAIGAIVSNVTTA